MIKDVVRYKSMDKERLEAIHESFKTAKIKLVRRDSISIYLSDIEELNNGYYFDLEMYVSEESDRAHRVDIDIE